MAHDRIGLNDMFKAQKCPHCSAVIKKLEFSDKHKNFPWYKLTKLYHACPFCGIGLAYDKKSQIKAFSIFCVIAIPSALYMFFRGRCGGTLFFVSGMAGMLAFSNTMKLVVRK